MSTTGQPSPAIKLGGAGFKVYRISLLSKADQFTQNTDGSYDAASILDAYRKSSYDQDTLKFDFSAEEQAVATMYESDTAAVNRYNATLTADGDFANGQGLGWVPTNNAQEYRLSEIFTNEEGILRVQGLPTASTSSWKRRCQKMFFRPNRSLSPSMRPARRAALLCPPAASQRPAAAT